MFLVILCLCCCGLWAGLFVPAGGIFRELTSSLLVPLLRRCSPCQRCHQILCRGLFPCCMLSLLLGFLPWKGVGRREVDSGMCNERCCFWLQGRSMFSASFSGVVLSPLVPPLLGGPFILCGFLPSLDTEGRQRGGVAMTDVWKHIG